MNSILIVEDDAELGELISDILLNEGFEATLTETGRQGLDAFQKGRYNMVLTDFRLPEMGGIELMAEVRKLSKRIPVVLMTAHGTTRLAIEATQKGAYDYLIKPFKTKDLVDVVKRALETSRMAGRRVNLGSGDSNDDQDAIIGNARGMQEVYREIGRIADKNVTVLIQGETGTGKELVARAVYQYSDRCENPFIAVNCSAIPDNLLESELFGHEKGSFTGATTRRIGRFEQADGGTLFLDEIGDMSLDTQVKMLRVLQERQIRRVGGDDEIPVDVRVIAATHQNLEKAVANGKFREDLYFRINTAIIDLPPLRDREGDIPILIEHFITRYCKESGIEAPQFEQGVMQILETHRWPGNVRELENFIRKMIIKSNGYLLTLKEVKSTLKRSSLAGKAGAADDDGDPGWKSHVADVLTQASAGDLSNPYSHLVVELEKEMFSQALALCNYNQSKASTLLGISRVSFRDKIMKYGLKLKKDQ